MNYVSINFTDYSYCDCFNCFSGNFIIIWYHLSSKESEVIKTGRFSEKMNITVRQSRQSGVA